MKDNKPTYIEGIGWRYAIEHSMLRRMTDHDYQSRCIYMITIATEGRKNILGTLQYPAGKLEEAIIIPTPLGKEVQRCWIDIQSHYPDVKPLAFQLMPDHIHGLLFITKNDAPHLGKIINGFKIGCNRAYRQLVSFHEVVSFHEALPHDRLDCPCSHKALPHDTKPPKHPTHGLLFAPGYQDSILKGKDQLAHMFSYIADNPKRLAIKRSNPDLFRVVSNIRIGDQTFASIGNRWLLDRPTRLQVRCHNNTTPENLHLIANQKAYYLKRGAEGAVIVSPCISAGEKEIARAALDAQQPLIVILENGFPPMYKPPGKYFEACANGLLLMLAPWQYHMEKRTITRQQCLMLNEMASTISTETWTQELENTLSHAR